MRRSLPQFCLDHPIGTIALLTAVVVAGVVSFVQLPIALMPDIVYPMVRVQITATQTPPEVLVNTVTRVLEQELAQVEGLEQIESTTEQADVILVDGCDRWGTAPAFFESGFFETLHARLTDKGLLVLNLIGRDHRKETLLGSIDRAFRKRRLFVDVREGSNRLLFAFKDAGYRPEWRLIQDRAAALAEEHGLDFPFFARQLRRRLLTPGA